MLGPALSKIDEVFPEDLAALIRVRAEEGRELLDADQMRSNVPRSLAGHVEALVIKEGPACLLALARRSATGWLPFPQRAGSHRHASASSR